MQGSGQAANRIADLFGHRLAHGGERHTRVASKVQIVKAHQREIARHPNPATVELVERPQSHDVVGAHDGIQLARPDPPAVE